MAKVLPGRFTAETDEPFVILRFGIRVNRFLLFWKWIPTVIAIVPVLRLLLRSRTNGLLGGFFLLYWSASMGLVQYWRSIEDLERCLEEEGNIYQKLWHCYQQSPGSDGSVGIWYEVFPIRARNYEVVYDNTPVIGLAAATKHIPAVGRRETARRRLGGQGEPAVPTPGNSAH